MRGGDLLGVVLAGGKGRRFGGEKATAPLGGHPMAEWVLEALRPWTSEQVVITNDPATAQCLNRPGRADLIPGKGPMGGLHTALNWAKEEGKKGVFLLACDLPLVPPPLVGTILKKWPSGVQAVVPGSYGPRGFEPLCGGYSTQIIPILEKLLSNGDLAMEAVLDHVGAHRIPASELGSEEELRRAFTNVNTQEGARLAELALGEAGPGVDS
jgi:molybdopterin-guanine dinucleotide biosynthesis protein A